MFKIDSDILWVDAKKKQVSNHWSSIDMTIKKQSKKDIVLANVYISNMLTIDWMFIIVPTKLFIGRD